MLQGKVIRQRPLPGLAHAFVFWGFCAFALITLIAFISVIGALQVMGLWGIFIGPIVASCLFALIQIFNAELNELSKEREVQGASPPSTVALSNASTTEPVTVAPNSNASSPDPAATEVAAANRSNSKGNRKRRR